MRTQWNLRQNSLLAHPNSSKLNQTIQKIQTNPTTFRAGTDTKTNTFVCSCLTKFEYICISLDVQIGSLLVTKCYNETLVNIFSCELSGETEQVGCSHPILDQPHYFTLLDQA